MNNIQRSRRVRSNTRRVRNKFLPDSPNQCDSGCLVVVAAGEG